MKPEAVPIELEKLVEKGARALWNAQAAQRWQMIEDGGEWPSWVALATRDLLREKALHVLTAVLPDIQAMGLRDFADSLPAAWQRPNGLADAARSHADHLLECTCAETAHTEGKS